MVSWPAKKQQYLYLLLWAMSSAAFLVSSTRSAEAKWQLYVTSKIISWKTEPTTASSSTLMINKQATSCNRAAKVLYRFRNELGSNFLSWSLFVMSLKNFELSKKFESELCKLPHFPSSTVKQSEYFLWKISVKNSSPDTSCVFYKQVSYTAVGWSNPSHRKADG